MKKFEIHDVENAYRKLKSYIYYDNFFIYLREKIALFENGEIELKLALLLEFLNSGQELSDNNYFLNLLEQIEYVIMPKSYLEDELDEDFVITNKFTDKSYDIDQINYLIDAPIEVHLISVLWILTEGKGLVKKYGKSNYAYALEVEQSEIEVVDGLRLFKPYFEQYQMWRDKAINTAQHFVKDDTDVLMISLDVKKYFYNIDLTTESIKKRLFSDIQSGFKEKENKPLTFTPLLLKIHSVYQSKLELPKELSKDRMIPIGMISSGILGNWFLSELDKQIIENLSPAYYGRYVDDILIVLSNTCIPDEKKAKDSVLNSFFIKRDIFKQNVEPNPKTGKDEKFYSWKDNLDIRLQKSKISIYAFDSKGSKSILEKFKKRIEKNSSAFWFLPEEDDVNNDFDESVYELTYGDTVNKLRSVQGIKQSKYGASVFLAKKIKLSLLVKKEKDEKTKDQILSFFKGRMNLEFNSIWEKALTYFVISDEPNAYWTFVRECLSAVDKLKYNESEITLEKIKLDQGRFILNCIALSLSLNPKFYNYLREKFKEITYTWFSSEKIESLIQNYRNTNLFRHYFVVQPLLNYSKVNSKDKESYVDFRLENYDSLELDKSKFKYSPRFVYLHEFIHYFSFITLTEAVKKIDPTSQFFNVKDLFLEFNNKEECIKNKVIDMAFDQYFELNYRLRNPQQFDGKSETEISKEKNKLFNSYCSCSPNVSKVNGVIYDEMEIGKAKKSNEKPKIAIANIIVEGNNIAASMLQDPILSHDRRKLIISILNQAEKCKSDILVLPEVSVPYQWLPIISDEARRKQRIIIGGLEHIRVNNVCFNLMFTCVPVERNGIKEVIINLRLKNHYSPHESKTIRNKGKIVPIPFPATYNKFIWKKIHFSVYNCYELTDITHRSIFRSEVDLLFASEYNRDINYFSNITDTISRDIHCYFVQVNSSDYGDSRITSPSRSEIKDLMRLKGGKNSVVLYDEVDLRALREFQSTLIDGQNPMRFKNTPPDYSHDKAEKRFNSK